MNDFKQINREAQQNRLMTSVNGAPALSAMSLGKSMSMWMASANFKATNTAVQAARLQEAFGSQHTSSSNRLNR